MKHLTKITGILIIFITLVFMGCKKDDIEPTTYCWQCEQTVLRDGDWYIKDTVTYNGLSDYNMFMTMQIKQSDTSQLKCWRYNYE